MSEKLVLIDGHSILNRAFFGIPDLTNSEGLHTNAVYGFLNILFKILEEEQETAGAPSKPFRPARCAATATLLALRATSPVSGESVL